MTTPVSAELPIVPSTPPARTSRWLASDDAESTFERFYFEQRDAVVRAVSLATGDPDQAAESVDEAMIRAYQRWSYVGTLDRPAGWTYRVAINLSRSRRRRLLRKARHARFFAPDHHDDATFAAGISDDRLLTALRALDDDQRAVVVLRVLLQFSERECAQALGIRPGTAKSRLHRGLARLRSAVPHLAPDIDALSPRTTHQHPSTTGRKSR